MPINGAGERGAEVARYHDAAVAAHQRSSAGGIVRVEVQAMAVGMDVTLKPGLSTRSPCSSQTNACGVRLPIRGADTPSQRDRLRIDVRYRNA